MSNESREAFETIRNLIEATDNLNDYWIILLNSIEYNINDGEECFETKVRELPYVAEYVDDTDVVDMSREAFERAFPIPKGANYVIGLNRYGAGVYTEPSMTRYNSKWEGWQACEQLKIVNATKLRIE
jgi:hypothetical protein